MLVMLLVVVVLAVILRLAGELALRGLLIYCSSSPLETVAAPFFVVRLRGDVFGDLLGCKWDCGIHSKSMSSPDEVLPLGTFAWV